MMPACWRSNLATDEIVPIHGAMEALNLFLNAVTRPGDAVVVESTTFYIALRRVVCWLGCPLPYLINDCPQKALQHRSRYC